MRKLTAVLTAAGLLALCAPLAHGVSLGTSQRRCHLPLPGIPRPPREDCGEAPERRFLSELEQGTRGVSVAPILWSFPGSGNSWLRLLIEMGSGYYTGSVYHRDQEMRAVFGGEDFCDSSVV
eukprot:Hpha_TRINITY_DN32613_c0_g1::TRINITY_DN32613_c0_g1_i1::g.30394::m.30394